VDVDRLELARATGASLLDTSTPSAGTALGVSPGISP